MIERTAETRRRVRTGRRAASALAVIAGVVAWNAAGGASTVAKTNVISVPDLVQSRLVAAPKAVAPGTAVRIADTVKNRGRTRSRRSVTRYYLSRDAKRGRGDKALGRRGIRALKPRKASKSPRRRRVIPASAAPGEYRLLACADATRKVRERNERNNCRSASIRLIGGGSGSTPGGSGSTPGDSGPEVARDDDGDGSTNKVDCAPKDPTVHPGAPDKPDLPAFADTNCDGIDGDEARAVFASPMGNNLNPGTRTRPKRNIALAMNIAAGEGKDVYAAAGVYGETLLFNNRQGVYGGYGLDWSRSLSNVTRVTAGSPVGASVSYASSPTTLQLLTLATPAPVSSGLSSYGLRAVRSPGLRIERVVVSGGNGAAGTKGANGTLGLPGGAGGAGVDGDCDRFQGSGGSPGTSPVGRTGGGGGSGGNQGANQGYDGGPGRQLPPLGGGPGGVGGDGGDPGSPGGKGGAGETGPRGVDGAPSSSGTFIGLGSWARGDGHHGAQGAHGHGGGGGGGGGGQGCTLCNDGGGNGGGGGGGGGAGGGGGRGGTGGGGSFGIFLVGSPGVVIKDSVISAGNGGAGAGGGAGAFGGAGGAGGLGGDNCTDEIGKGGNGGLGGSGGIGGAGGGGAGGPSIALFTVASDGIISVGNTLSFGAGGAGGTGAGLPGGAGRAGPTN